MIGIYKITDIKGQQYIGLSRNIKERWETHRQKDFTNHTFEVLEEVNISNLSKNKGDAVLRKRERWWIKELDTFKNGLNENGGGSGCNAHTAESKAKISAANKGKPKPKGFGENRKKWQHSEEWKEKLRVPKPSYWKSREGCVSSNLGKIMSEEQKLKISASNKGKPKPKGFGAKISAIAAAKRLDSQ